MRMRTRLLLAGVCAIALHAMLVWLIGQSAPRRFFPRDTAAPLWLTLAARPARAPPLPTTPVPPEREPPAPRVRQAPAPPVVEAAAASPAVPAPAPPQPLGVTATAPAGEGAPRVQSAIGNVLGTRGPLSPTLAVLENSLEVRAEGPTSDGERAARTAKRQLTTDLATDAVSAGLVDDYFRELGQHIDTAWAPALKQLNDGGESVGRVSMMRDAFAERAAWDEMWRAYLDLAGQYARGARPQLEPSRKDRLRELMRSRKGMFRVSAVAELDITQDTGGKVVTIEIQIPSGQPGIDEGIKDAIMRAVDAMPLAPPARLHRGGIFTSSWRMRATWAMVPPTALLTGAGFDITSKGITVDVPFAINLQKNVMLKAAPIGNARSD